MKYLFTLLICLVMTSISTVSLAANGATTEKSQSFDNDVGLDLPVVNETITIKKINQGKEHIEYLEILSFADSDMYMFNESLIIVHTDQKDEVDNDTNYLEKDYETPIKKNPKKWVWFI